MTFKPITLSKDDGNNRECLLDGEPLKNYDKIEIEWKNGIIERTTVIIEKEYKENYAHNDRWIQTINYPFTKIIHNGTEIKISLLKLLARRIENE